MKEDKIISVDSLLYEEFAADENTPTTPEPTTPAPTTPAPTTPKPTTPAPTPTPCPCCFATQAPVNFEKCQLTANETITTTITCVGRFLDIDVILKNVCPNKVIDIGVLVFENDKLITFKVCTFFTDSSGDACIASVNAGKFCFVFEEPTACPPARTFTVKVVANYIEN